MDRALQRSILEKLDTAYPGGLDAEEIGYDQADPAWARNAAYLAEHDLISIDRVNPMGGPPIVIGATITARGLDFLAADGGLTAILGVVTVRFDAETIRALLKDKIEASALPEAEKSRLRVWLEKLGKDGLEKATGKVLDIAIDSLPEALDLLQKLPDLVP